MAGIKKEEVEMMMRNIARRTGLFAIGILISLGIMQWSKIALFIAKIASIRM